MSEVILVTSGKGGTGKTMFTVNIGTLLAQRGYKTVLIDMDMGLRNMDIYMGLENNVVYNIMDVLSGVCRVRKALIKDRRFNDLYMMAATSGADDRDITPLHMQILCEKLRDSFDYIIIDSPAGMSEGFINAAVAVDKAVVVTEPEVASIRDADTIDNCLEEIGIEKRFFVVNKVRASLMASGTLPDLSSISDILKPKLLGVIQDDDNIFASTNTGVPIVLKEGTYININFNRILDRLIEE